MPILKPIRGLQLNKSHPLTPGLVLCGSADGGRNLFDLSGNKNHGTFYGDTHCVGGKFGWAWNFDGYGDYVDIGGVGATGTKTFSFWFKSADISQLKFMLYLVNSGQEDIDYIAISTYSSKILASGDNESVDSRQSSTLQSNTWYHVVVTKTAGAVTAIYINGNDDTQAASVFLSGTTAKSIIGGTWYQGYLSHVFTGTIDHVMIFNRALAAAEVAHLYREPFCMFDVAIEPSLLYPAGQIVWLAAASMATASTHGSLTKQSTLAGIIDTTATLSGILTLRYRGQVERQWLVEALFNGMTANAFKLGTVLTGGWFWMWRSGCSALYRGPSMERINFANILTVAEQDASSISPPDYLPHHSNSTYFYVARRFNICGYQECTLAAAVKVAIDAEGNLVEPKPNNIFAWRIEQVHSNKIQLIWFYCPLEQKSQPVCFQICYDGGTGHIDYENPIATINYQGRKFYTYQSDALAAGRYLFAIRAEDADDVENNSLAQLAIQLTTKSPDAVNVLSAEAV